MPNIFPDASKGGIIVSNGGVATGASGVTNAWLPVAGFTVTCPVTAYPDANCAFQITGATLNAINAEMGMLAQTMNPTGVWNCGTTGNLAANFTAWAAANPSVIGTVAVGPATTNLPAIPTIHFGTNTGYLGAPVRWISFVLPGVTGLVTVPSYT